MIKTTFISTLAKMTNPFNLKLLQTHIKTLVQLVRVAMDLVTHTKSSEVSNVIGWPCGKHRKEVFQTHSYPGH